MRVSNDVSDNALYISPCEYEAEHDHGIPGYCLVTPSYASLPLSYALHAQKELRRDLASCTKLNCRFHDIVTSVEWSFNCFLRPIAIAYPNGIVCPLTWHVTSGSMRGRS